MNYKDISKEHLNSHIDRLLDITKDIEPYKVTVLTGGNALGKSVIRKILAHSLEGKLKEEKVNKNKLVASISMQTRTESKPEWAAFSSIGHDLPWSSTSDSTIHLIDQVLQSEKRYIVLDELELGMSKEVQKGMCIQLNRKIPEILEKNYGLLIITHSDIVVENTYHDKFVNIEGMSESEWLNREIIPVDPKDIKDWTAALFCTIRDRSK